MLFSNCAEWSSVSNPFLPFGEDDSSPNVLTGELALPLVRGELRPVGVDLSPPFDFWWLGEAAGSDSKEADAVPFMTGCFGGGVSAGGGGGGWLAASGFLICCSPIGMLSCSARSASLSSNKNSSSSMPRGDDAPLAASAGAGLSLPFFFFSPIARGSEWRSGHRPLGCCSRHPACPGVLALVSGLRTLGSPGWLSGPHAATVPTCPT